MSLDLWRRNMLIIPQPVMIDNIGWGTYLFFAVVNACFLPIIYFWYPETARRSLEEIDLIFAKGYTEKISYVRAARELPYLTDEEIERMAIQYGFGPAEITDSQEKASSHSDEFVTTAGTPPAGEEHVAKIA